MKEYLKMADVFGPGKVISRRVIGDSYQIVAPDGNQIAVINGADEVTFVASAINSHDELVAEVERLRKRVSELEEFTYHFCDNSYNVDLGGGDCTATTCEAKEMAHKLDNRAWPDLWPGH